MPYVGTKKWSLNSVQMNKNIFDAFWLSFFKSLIHVYCTYPAPGIKEKSAEQSFKHDHRKDGILLLWYQKVRVRKWRCFIWLRTRAIYLGPGSFISRKAIDWIALLEKIYNSPISDFIADGLFHLGVCIYLFNNCKKKRRYA